MAVFVSIHYAGDISASAGGSTGAPLHISVDRLAPRIPDEVTLFTDDHDLSRKLADAINATVKEHRAALEKKDAA